MRSGWGRGSGRTFCPTRSFPPWSWAVDDDLVGLPVDDDVVGMGERLRAREAEPCTALKLLLPFVLVLHCLHATVSHSRRNACRISAARSGLSTGPPEPQQESR